jgi:hypothetical protein
VRVQLLPELFQRPTSDALLIAFINYALTGRHTIELNLEHPLVRQWHDAQSAGVKDDVALAVQISTDEEALQPSHTEGVVGLFGASDYNRSPIRLRIQDARQFLETPISLILEDAQSDREFLFKMLTPNERTSLQNKLHEGFVRVEHGGGIGSMQTRLLELNRDPKTQHKYWALFDSDALQPRVPSTQSEDLRAACHAIPHYQLSRRYVESYLPGPALSAWATVGVGRSARRRRLLLLKSYFGMTKPQRAHFNMKRGFDQDARRTDATAGSLYNTVTDADRMVLKHGFGPRIREEFLSDAVTEVDLRRDSGWNEMRPVVHDLLSRLR